MTIVVVNQGEEQFLDRILGINYQMKLFTNDVTSGLTAAQVDALTESSFTEATFTGYAAATLASASWTSTPGDPGVASYAQQTFTRSSTGTLQNVYGYYVVRSSDGALAWFEKFPGPAPIEFSGDAIRVTPRITLQDTQDSPGAIEGTVEGMAVLSIARTADAGTALNEAIASLPATGGTIIVPAGTWTIDQTVEFDRNGIVIQGMSKSATVLQFDGATVTPAFAMTDTTQRHGVIRDLTITSSTSGSGTAIDASYFINSVFENLHIGGAGANPNRGVVFDALGTYYNVVRDCRITAVGSNARCILFDNTSNSNRVENCRLLGDNTNTIMVYVNAHAIQIDRVDIEADGLIGIDVASSGHDCTVNAPYIEAIETGIRLASNVEAFTCTGGIIIDNTTNITDNGAKDPAFINTRLQYEPYTSYTARSTAFPQSYPIQTSSDQPQDHSLISWTFDPADVQAGSLLTNGTVYLSKVYVRNRATLANVYWWVTAVAVTATAGQNEVGLYDSTGARVGATNVDADITSTGLKTTAVSATLTPGWYWVGMVFNASTAPTLARATNTTGVGTGVNVGLATAGLRFATNATAQTSLPVSVTPASNAATAFAGPWAAIG
jgi:hypothetical protein